MPTASGGPLQLVALPFVSQRGIVRSEQLMEQAAYQHAQDYAERLQLLIHTLVDACDPEVPTVVAAHAFVRGGAPGGGERLAHLVEEYAVAAQSFPRVGRPTSPSATSTGRSSSPAGPPSTTAGRRSSWTSARRTRPSRSTWSSSPPASPAAVTPVPLTSGRPLRTVAGTMDELRQAVDPDGDAWLRVKVREQARAGLADEVRDLLGEQVVDVQIERRDADPARRRRSRSGSSPQELFAEFLAERDVDDPGEALFADLYDELHQGAEA